MVKYTKWIKLKDGNELYIFFNKDTELLVVDKVRKDRTGGNEFIRVNVKNIPLPRKCEYKLGKVV